MLLNRENKENRQVVLTIQVEQSAWEKALEDIRRQGGDPEAYFESRLQGIPLKRAQTMEDIARFAKALVK